ncbi:hypothetical protein [Nocardia sp. NBC_01327]|uniref:hypothetical protein n=1 Tax=Nocardia sp. NBC_01327 TaxID=2903593 RepID=UPI002E105B07|nr:hypothetical protein OG326_35510 [Nocardia sp. NBC_01327]
MTGSALKIRRYGGGLSGIVPAGAATVLDAAAAADTMVLEVAGGYLSWSVLAGQSVPAAVIDDLELAQEWVWAIYGAPIALALDRDQPAEATAAPALPALAVSAWRLAYAHWAARWWPASTLDGIAPLDAGLLERDIAALTLECESLVDGADALAPVVAEMVETRMRASDYALAAGDETPDGLVLARGVGGWDWRRCPPGLVDASERAVSWQAVRAAGATTVAVSAVAAPGVPAEVPAYLRPWARIDTGTEVGEIALRAEGGAWVGELAVAGADPIVRVDIHVPGFGVDDGADSAELRQRIRAFAAERLRRTAVPGSVDGAPDAPLLAEIAAAADDSDF